MTVKMDAKKKKLFLFGGIGAGVIAAVVVILLVTGILTHSELYRKLAADGTATIEINEDIDVKEMLVVNGDKTLVGNGTIHAKKGEYAIVINPNAKLTIDGPSVDCEDGATNGVYTSEAATFVFNAGTIKNTDGHGVRVLGTSTFTGGGIDTVGTNWLMIDENAAATITKGDFTNADEIGIISGSNSTLDISGDVTLDNAVDNLVYAAGTTNINGGTYAGHIDYAFYNAGTMNISNVSMSNAKGLGYIQNIAGAKMNLSNVSFLGSKTDYIYNLGILNAENLILGDCTNSAIENTGKKASLTLKNVIAGKIGASFILNKNANVTVEQAEIEEVTAYVVYNRAANLNAKGIKVNKVGGSAFLNDFVDAKSTTSIGVMNIDDFEIGEVAANGLRSNGGSVKLSNGTFGVCQNHALYIKDGAFDCDSVKFKGAAATKVVIQIGYKTTLTAKAEFKNCDITGGARGLVNYATTTITNSKFHDIQAAGSYKAGAALKNSGTMTITGTTFTGNRALSSGGAIYNVGKLTLGSGNVFSGNSSATSGGAIANGKAGTLKITGGTINNNKASNYAGGIYNSGTMSFTGAVVSNNYSTKGGGGIENTGSASISGGTFKDNKSGATGGAIYNGSKGTMTISGVTVSGNTSASNKSAGGVYNLGKMTIRNGNFTGNTAGTYGGAVANGVNTDGTVRGNLTIYGGNFNGNTAVANAGGAFYNRGVCTIAGGNFNGNNINSEKNGKSIYNSGDLTITGGTANDLSEKPYDIYSYKGNLYLSGSPEIGSIYKAGGSDVTIAGALTPSSQIKYYMGSYALGVKAFYGSTEYIAGYKSAFDLSHHDVSTTSTESTKYVDDEGVIRAPYVEEAELWRDGEKITTTNFSVVAKSAQDGDIIKIIGDVYVDEYIGLTCFSKSTIDATKSLTITGDGKKHTIDIDTGSDCGFYVAASNGDGGDGTSDSGYYRSSVNIELDATGLTFNGASDMESAAFFVSGPAKLNITGGTFQGFTNTAVNSAAADQKHSTGKNGAAISIGSSSEVSLNGTTFSKNTNAGSGGAALYCNGKLNVSNCSFYNNSTDKNSLKNGGAIYITSTGKLSVSNSKFAYNKANNGAGIYVYGGSADVTNCEFSNNEITGTTSTYAESIYATSAGDDNDKTYATLNIDGLSMECKDKTKNDLTVREGNTVTLAGKLKANKIRIDSLPINVPKAITSSSKINLVVQKSLYLDDAQVFTGKTGGLKDIFVVNDGTLKLNDNGVLYSTGKKEAELWRDGKKVTSSLFSSIAAAAEDGDTIKIISDITIKEYVGLSCFSKTTIDASKTLYITGDGKEHTITIATGSDCGLYIAASSGDGGTGTSDSGYYRSSMNVEMDATGLTFVGSGLQSAGIYVSGPTNLSITNGTFKNFKNSATESATEDQTHSTGKNGAVMSVGASASVKIKGSTFTDNINIGSGGAAIYCNGKVNVVSATFDGNKAAEKLEKNGGAIYVTSTGTLAVASSTFTNNIANNGASIYSYGGNVKVIAGCKFTNNSIYGTSSTSGENIYVTSATIKDEVTEEVIETRYGSLVLEDVTAKATGKLSDISVREGNALTIGGRLDVDTLRTETVPVKAPKAVTTNGNINLVLPKALYLDGTKVFAGNTSSLKNIVTVNDGTLLLNDNGVLYSSGAKEAELWRNGAKVAASLFSSIVASAQDGDTIKIINDIYIDEFVSLTCFSKSAIDTTKTYNITGDGNAHTISIATGADCGFYVAASSGDGGTGTSESGYYRSKVVVNLDATNLTFEGAEDMESAAFYVSGPATFNIKKGTFKNFTNIATESATDEQTHSTGKKGAVMSIGASSTVIVDGSTFSNNSNAATGGAAFYNSGKLRVRGATFDNNKTDLGSGKNGGAIYVTTTGTLTADGCTFTNNRANNGAAIYAYAGKVTLSNSCKFEKNTIEGTDSSYGESVYLANAPIKDEKTGEVTETKYGSLDLGSTTVKSTKDYVGISVKAGNTFILSGKLNVDTIKVETLPVSVASAITSDTGVKIEIPDALYVSGTQVFTGTTTGLGSIFTVNDGDLNLDDTGKLTGVRNVASIGDTNYPSITAAIQAAVDGDTIKLIRDVKADTSVSAISVGKIVTFDINGHALTSSGKYQIFNVASGATLTLVDSVGTGYIKPGTGSYAGRVATISGTLNFQSGLVKEGNSTSSSGGGAFSVSSSGVLNMTGGKIADCNAAYTSTSTGGTFGAITVSGTFNFKGGEITGCTQENPDSVNIGGKGVLNISNEALVDATFGATTTNVTGGYYKVDVTAKCATGYRCVSDTTHTGYSYKVEVDPTVKAAASVNGTEYNSFDAAMTAIGSTTGTYTVKLLKDCTQSNPANAENVVSGQNITLDLNGYTLNGSHQRSIFNIGAGATVTITDTSADTKGVIKNTSASNAGAIATVKGTLNLSAGTMTGVTTGNGGAVRVWTDGTFNMTGGKITGSSASKGGVVYVGGSSSAGTFNMTGGEITGNTTTTVDSGDIFVTYSNSVLSIDNSETIDAKIKASIVFDTSVVTTGNQIIGGYFATNTNPLPDNYIYVADTTYTGYGYKVVYDAKIAQIGTTTYPTLESALTAANGMTSATVKMLADVTDFTPQFSITGDVTIDLNGYTITPAASAYYTFNVSGKLTVDDTQGGGKINAGSLGVFVAADQSTVNITGDVTIGAVGSESLVGAGTYNISGNARISGTDLQVVINITGGFFEYDVTSLLTSDYKCVADTTYTGFGYKVKAVDGYEQPGGTDGKDITDIDKFDETEPAPPQ